MQNLQHERIKVKVPFLSFFFVKVCEVCIDSQNSTIPPREKILNFDIAELFFEFRFGKLSETITKTATTAATRFIQGNSVFCQDGSNICHLFSYYIYLTVAHFVFLKILYRCYCFNPF